MATVGWPVHPVPLAAHPVRRARTGFPFWFSLACFFPNPALPLGDATGLALAQALALVAIAVAGRVPARHLLVAYVLYAPLAASAVAAIATGSALHAPLVAKYLIVVAPLAVVPLLPAGRMARPDALPAILTGAATAILVHASIGLLQVVMFTRGVFPLAGLYQNPSFRSVATTDYALSLKRPFGLFPEPSAMAASLGPWLVIIVGILAAPALRARLTRRETWLLAAAAVSGSALIILSRTGYAPILPFCLGLPLAIQAQRRTSVTGAHGCLAIVALALLALGALSFTAMQLGDRLAYETNTSWQLRWTSILLGLGTLDDSLRHLAFGVGAGLAGPTMTALYPGFAVPGSESELVTVWSVAGRYVMETGLLGAAALAAALGAVIAAIRRSSARATGLAALFAWLVGVTFATSYLALAPLWLCFGLLLAWDTAFPPAWAGADHDAPPRHRDRGWPS